jgi:hypothetical protein
MLQALRGVSSGWGRGDALVTLVCASRGTRRSKNPLLENREARGAYIQEHLCTMSVLCQSCPNSTMESWSRRVLGDSTSVPGRHHERCQPLRQGPEKRRRLRILANWPRGRSDGRIPSEGDPHDMAVRLRLRLHDVAYDHPPFGTVIVALAGKEDLDHLIVG